MLGVKSTLPFKWVGPSMKKISNAGDNKMIGIFHEIASSSCSMYFLECPNLFQIKNHQTLKTPIFNLLQNIWKQIFHFLFTQTIVLNFTHMIPILLKLSIMQRSCFFGCRDVIVWCCRGAVGRTYRKGNMENGNR